MGTGATKALASSLRADEKLDIDILRKVLPGGRKGLATPELVNDLNQILLDPAYRENFRDNLLSYISVLGGDGRVRIQDYVNAVKFVSLRMLGAEVGQAYAKVFPERYKRLIDRGADSKTIANYCAAYNRTGLVRQLYEQSLVPSYLLNQDLYQRALNVQADLMMNAKSEKVRTDAANSLLQQLKLPETQKLEIDVTQKQDDSINELRRQTMELVAQQKRMIEAGITAVQEIAEQKIVSGERIDD